MRLIWLGTGTSHGIPMIGCDCEVCRSPDPRDHRMRSSLHVEHEGYHLQVDTPPEFRMQVLAAGIRRVDAVFITHTHADHIFGMDDLRAFSDRQPDPIPVWGSSASVGYLRHVFRYVLFPGSGDSSCPRLDFREMPDEVRAGPFRVVALPVEHGSGVTWGYRIEADGRAIAYIPDCKRIPPPTFERLRNLDVMILDALRPTPHPTHLSLPESLELLLRIGARRSFITHLSHHLGHSRTAHSLPSGVEVPWDGRVLDIP